MNVSGVIYTLYLPFLSMTTIGALKFLHLKQEDMQLRCLGLFDLQVHIYVYV